MLNISRQFLSNIFSSWVAYLVRMGITFFFVPYVIHTLGGERYGIWVIIFQTVFYFSFFDLGLSTALTRFVSRFLSKHDYRQINKVLNTSNLIYLVLGILLMAGVYVFVKLFFHYFKITDPALVDEGATALLILGIFLAFNFIARSFGDSLGAFHRYDIANVLNISEEIIRTLLMVFCLWQGYSLIALASVILIVSVLKHILSTVILLRLHPQVVFSFRNFDYHTARMLFTYSKIAWGISLCWLVLYNTDTFLLGLMSSPLAAAIYYPGAQLMRPLRNAINAIAVPLLPAVSHINETRERADIQRIYFKVVRYVSFFAFIVTAGVLIYADDFVQLWLTPEFSQTAVIMRILALGTALLLPQIAGNAILFAIEQHRKLLLVLLCESVIKLVLSVILIRMYGVIGMALATALPQILLFTTLYPYLMADALGTSYHRIMKTIAASSLPAILGAIPAAFLMRYIFPPHNFGIFFINVGVVLLAGGVISYYLSDKDDRLRLKDWFRQIAVNR